jgi:NAD(P)-dependent dehydrogenase (short-subunit alcohol dehydrogenase family)
MAGKTVVITGASAGIGAAAARQLAALGASVVVVGRSPSKTAAVAEEVGGVPLVADFADLAQVRALAESLLAQFPRIDVLANNAGGTWPKRVTTVDGHELTFQVNHLAPYLLTRLLESRLIASKARVIQTSSAAHGLGNVVLADLDTAGRYSGNRIYGTTKLENILFTKELQRRWGASGVLAAAFHPGVVASDFGRDSSLIGLVYRTPLNRFMRSNDDGADTLTWLASTDGWIPGGYYANRKTASIKKSADDPVLAAGLWEASAKLVDLPVD